MGTTWKESGLAALTPKEAKVIMKANLIGIGESWHAVYLPKHFKAGAENIYKLEYRTAAWIKRVKKNFPNWRPLLMTGTLRNACTTNYTVKPNVKGDAIQVKLSMKRGHATRVTPYSVGAEVTKVNDKEVREMLKQMKTKISEDITNIPAKENK